MGRVAKHVTDARRQKLQTLLAENVYLPLAEVCERLGISEATARRDLASLETQKLITRTHGGALGPYASEGGGELGDFEASFPTFDQRRRDHAKAKTNLAKSCCEMLKAAVDRANVADEEFTLFLDSGSTCYAVAEAIEESGMIRKSSGRAVVTVVTHNIAVAVKLARVEGIDVHVVGGKLLPRQAGMFGDEACKAVSGRRIHWAVLSCEGIDAKGTWNSQQDVVRFQRAAIAAADRHVFLIDSSKVGHQAPVFLAAWSQFDLLITDASREQLTKSGINLSIDRVRYAGMAAQSSLAQMKRKL